MATKTIPDLTAQPTPASTDLIEIAQDSDGASRKCTLAQAVTAAGVSSLKQLAVFRPQQNEPPASNPATIDTRNARPVLDFDDTTQEVAVFSGVMPDNYTGGNITVKIHYMATSATSGNAAWGITFERNEDGATMTSDGWATEQLSTPAAVPGTAGIKDVVTTSHTAGSAGTDSIVAGDEYRIRIRRDVANDTVAGDLELLKIEVVEV